MNYNKPFPVIRCDDCGGTMVPVKFVEEERDNYNSLTGRKRIAVSHLECDWCMNQGNVDDSFDEPWK